MDNNNQQWDTAGGHCCTALSAAICCCILRQTASSGHRLVDICDTTHSNIAPRVSLNWVEMQNTDKEQYLQFWGECELALVMIIAFDKLFPASTAAAGPSTHTV